MITKVKPTRAGASLALLACGVAGLLAVTGCSSSSGSNPAAGSSPSTAASNTAAAPTNAASSTAPAWAAALGPGVTVLPPGTATPGHGSPGAVISGLFSAIQQKSASGYCGYAEPSVQAQCKSGLGQMSASQFPTAKNPALGYIAIDGDKAVAGVTGTLCQIGQTECDTNGDPAAVFSTLHTFSALWKNAITSSGPKYSLTPLAKVNGNWYVYTSS